MSVIRSKIIDYKVVCEGSVLEYLNKGYELYGNPVFTITDGEFCQALILYEACQEIDYVHVYRR